jgi:hypothetical protein
MGMTARFSRIGVDTRTLTALGTLETRTEGDFGGGPPASTISFSGFDRPGVSSGPNFPCWWPGEQPLERRHVRDPERLYNLNSPSFARRKSGSPGCWLLD